MRRSQASGLRAKPSRGEGSCSFNPDSSPHSPFEILLSQSVRRVGIPATFCTAALEHYQTQTWSSFSTRKMSCLTPVSGSARAAALCPECVSIKRPFGQQQNLFATVNVSSAASRRLQERVASGAKCSVATGSTCSPDVRGRDGPFLTPYMIEYRFINSVSSSP